MRKKVLVRGPALSRSGYGEHTRFILRCLKSREDLFDIYLHNLNWGKTGWIWEQNEERAWLDHLILKTVQFVESGGQFDLSLQVTIPNEWEKVAPINIGVTAGIETTKVPPQWVEKSNIMDHIITISEHSKFSLANTSYQVKNNQTGEIIEDFRCTTPIEVVHYPVRDFEPAQLDLELETDFNFLTVAQISPRKNVENTIKWFVEEFIDQPVGLVIKLNVVNNSSTDRLHTENLLQQLLKEYESRKCKVYLLHGSVTDEEMAGLYQHPKIKAYISLAHGEGFGLPIFEAVYNELPVIAPDWSGHVDFLYKPVKDKKTGKEKLKAHFARVKYTMQQIQKQAVWEGVLQADSMWCFPEQGSYKMRLREVYKDYQRFKSQAKKLNVWIRDNFKAEQKYSQVCDLIIENHLSMVPDQEIDDMFKELFSESMFDECNLNAPRDSFVQQVHPYQKIQEIPIGPGDIAIDCGANVGKITDYLQSQGATVYAFEPNPHAFSVLKSRFKDNPRVFCIDKGVAGNSRIGEAKLFLHERATEDPVLYSSGCSIISDKKNVVDTDHLSIQIVDLCKFIKKLEKPVKILKIDIEGAEIELLNDLIDQKIAHDVEHILVETHEKKIPSLREPTEKLIQRIKNDNISNINLDWI